MTLTREQRLDEMDQVIAEGRLLRGRWSNYVNGQRCLCLLAALSPEVCELESASACPADLMPQWLAHLTIWIDEPGTGGEWRRLIKRYAGLVHRWHVLNDGDWRQLDYSARRITLEHALPYAGRATEAVQTALALLRRAEAGGDVTGTEWHMVCRPWPEMPQNASAEQRAVIWAERAVAAATEQAANWARRAPDAVECAARLAGRPLAPIADSITTAILDAIEARITERESGNG